MSRTPTLRIYPWFCSPKNQENKWTATNKLRKDNISKQIPIKIQLIILTQGNPYYFTTDLKVI